MKTVFEPFKIKMVEPLAILSPQERRGVLKECNYNLFSVPARAVTFDFLTDSGTSAMSARQWAAMLEGDESYAGSESYARFASAVGELTGMEHVIPTHQGRSAEALLCQVLVESGCRVLGNTQFDTTRANIESAGGISVDLPSAESASTDSDFPFKGNVDLKALRAALEENSVNVAFFIMTVTNNSIGGQPVSLENIRQTKSLLNEFGIAMFIDAARFAENAYFIKRRERGQEGRSVSDIAKEMFSYADGVLMSAKKDAFANIGGFLALRDAALAADVRRRMVITEGFPTYGGLAGRDLEAIAVGLTEILSEEYLAYRIRSVEYFGRGLEQAGFKLMKPFGGHAVYIDARASLPHIPVKYYPAQALSVALYEEIGLRGVEVGSVMFGRFDEETGREMYAPKELVRLALPRRVYTQSHIDYIVESAAEFFPKVGRLPGFRIDEQAKFLRHFTAKFSPIPPGEFQ
jgi:tryptophanase